MMKPTMNSNTFVASDMTSHSLNIPRDRMSIGSCLSAGTGVSVFIFVTEFLIIVILVFVIIRLKRKKEDNRSKDGFSECF